jgi:hypothetical protein
VEEIAVESWAEFESKLAELFKRWGERKAGTILHVSDVLFRGHANSAWPLATTLERSSPKSLDLSAYYHQILRAKPHIETLTNNNWPEIDVKSLNSWLGSEQRVSFGMYSMPGYEYMVYLRHHGYPSPLLDWSRSPYVASFFAFSTPPELNADHQRVAIYAYVEYFGRGKTSTGGAARIQAQGQYVRSHRRHFAQQSDYTVCTQLINDKWVFAQHDSVFTFDDEVLLQKFTIPISERLNVLRILDRHNINAFSLFGSDESLVATLAQRETLYPR